MPNRDGTGPFGQGEMTGRGLGLCDMERNINTRNFARRRRINCGRIDNSKEVLNRQKVLLENRLDEINKQLNQN